MLLFGSQDGDRSKEALDGVAVEGYCHASRLGGFDKIHVVPTFDGLVGGCQAHNSRSNH